MDDNPFASPEAPQTNQSGHGEPKRWLGRLFLAVGFGCNALILSGIDLGISSNAWIGLALLFVTLTCIAGSAMFYWR